jgi:hypothetical protein
MILRFSPKLEMTAIDDAKLICCYTPAHYWQGFYGDKKCAVFHY